MQPPELRCFSAVISALNVIAPCSQFATNQPKFLLKRSVRTLERSMKQSSLPLLCSVHPFRCSSILFRFALLHCCSDRDIQLIAN